MTADVQRSLFRRHMGMWEAMPSRQRRQFEVAAKRHQAEKLVENGLAVLNAILRAKPSGAKGQYIKKFSISSTMGPGIELDTKTVTEKMKGGR